jgi:ribonuclease HI
MGEGEQLSLFEEEKKEAKENKTSLISTIEKPIKIYSDGSDIKGTGKVGFGAVYMYQNKEFGLSGTEEGIEVKDLAAKHPGAKFSNPTMEMLALATVLETFQDTGEHLSIYQDYSGAVNYNGLWQHSEGSEQRADKPWKAKELYIKDLVDRSVEAIKKIEANGGTVRINWIRGHAGDPMNEAADKYAKSRKGFNALLKPLSNEPIQPVTFKGKMSFSYGKNKREGLTADTTIQAVALGERTATTRYSDKQGFNYWKKAKKGDIIEWASDNGDSVKVKVTKPLEKLVGSGKTANAWSELEGWSIDYFNAVVRPKLDTAWQIEFEYIPDSYKNAINTAQEGTTGAPTSDYDLIEKFHADIIEQERTTGKKLITNLGTVDDLVEKYVEQFADSMSQEQFIEYIRNCG